MRNLLAASRLALIVSGGILAAAVILGAAQAATDTIYKYSTPKAGSFSIDNMAMSAAREPSGGYSNSSLRGLFVTSTPECFYTAVHLPQGSTVTSVKVYYTSGTVEGVSASLFRQDLASGLKPALGGGFLADASGTRKVGTMPLGTANLMINNNQYAYAFQICLRSSAVFHAARIGYTYTNAGD